ncbi:DNA-processing protein DprA [Amycolatopsis sp. NPDC057786]|uniref:DNA-processing protein DprA n=1 Tax=Amycolatopsis sp. NPDC057786 TaxID=3346250 RepID=UPI0036729EA3
MPASDDIVRARLFLMRATEPPTQSVGAYTAVHGPVDAADRIRAGCAPPAVLAEVVQPEPDLRGDLVALEAGHARLLTPEDDNWPSAAHDLAASGTGAPLGLWVRGDPQLGVLTAGPVAMVGSLAASPYGEYVAAELGRGIADRDIAVVNGAGFGVEAHALRGALSTSGRGRCLVVLACGIDVACPTEHGPLLWEIADSGGVLVTEYPLGTKPRRTRAYARQRLVAALSEATVIVEAGRRSPAVAVARTASRLGRRVYAVPGPVTSAKSAGTNELLRTGMATAVTCADEVTVTRGLR